MISRAMGFLIRFLIRAVITFMSLYTSGHILPSSHWVILLENTMLPVVVVEVAHLT